MAKPFEVVVEQVVEATPEQAWEAISTGLGDGRLVHGQQHDRARPRRRGPDGPARLHHGIDDHGLGSAAPLREHLAAGDRTAD